MDASIAPPQQLISRLRLTDKGKRRFVLVALALIGIGLVAFMRSPHDPLDPGECHIDNPDTPIPLPGEFRMAQVVTPYTVDLINRCPGGFRLSSEKAR